MAVFKFDDKEVYIEKAFADILKRKLYDVMHNKMDLVIICQGNEGSAKSYFMKQVAAYISTKTGVKFGLDNIHFNIKDYLNSAESGEKFQINILDEARADLYRGNSNSQVNKRFTNFMSWCRNLQQIHIIILPRWDDLDKYICLHRAHMIISVTIGKDKQGHMLRGSFFITGTKNKKKLNYLYKNKYSRMPESMKVVRGKFPHTDVINEVQYENKKNNKRKDTFLEKKEQEDNKVVLTPRQIEVISKISPYELFKDSPKDQEILRKMVYSLRKLGSGETG